MLTIAVVRAGRGIVGGRALIASVRTRTARSFVALTSLVVLAMISLGLLSSAVASQPRSNYALTVLLSDSQSPEIDLTLQLDPLTGNGSFAFWAKTMSANVTLGLGLAWALDGSAGGYHASNQVNVSSTAYFNFTAFIAPAVRKEITSNPGTPVFANFTAVVVYSDNLGANNRTIVRTVSFAVNYSPPPPAPLISLLPAGLLGVGGAGAIGAGVYVVRRARLEELYLMHDSGMLIRHWSRSKGVAHDSDIMSGMLIVLQEFVRDTWKSHQDEDAPLEQMRFGGQRVIMARGEHTVLAAVVEGRYLNGLPKKLQMSVVDFERSNADRLADWNGNVDVFPAVDRIAQRFLHGQGHGSA